jgi:hypothetical protein
MTAPARRELVRQLIDRRAGEANERRTWQCAAHVLDHAIFCEMLVNVNQTLNLDRTSRSSGNLVSSASQRRSETTEIGRRDI